MHHTSHTRTTITLIPLFWYFLKRPQPVTGNGQRATAPQLFYYKLEICLKCAPDLNALTRMAVALGTSGLVTGGMESHRSHAKFAYDLVTNSFCHTYRWPNISEAATTNAAIGNCQQWQAAMFYQTEL